MNESLLRLVRKTVRATHDWPVLNPIYRSMYRSAATAAGRLQEITGGAGAVYARNSYALNTWIPGRSDIDLTVIWREATRKQVDDFHGRYERLRKRFPMLGEVEMLDADHLEAWTSQAVTGLESRHWIKLSGDHHFVCRYAGDERLDRLRHAVAIYRYNLLPLYWRSAVPDESFWRFAAKLLRQFDKPLPPLRVPGEVLAACLRELSAQIAGLATHEESGTLDYPVLIGDMSAAERHSVDLGGACLALLGRALDPVPRYALVSPETETIARELEDAVVMDPNVFKFYLSSVDPLEYLSLLRGRIIFAGADPLSTPYPISASAFQSSVRYYAAQMLTYPYRREIPSMPSGQFRDLLYAWFLLTLRYFEDGRMDFQYHTLREYFGSRHCETQDRFQLLHGIADDLIKHLR
jgi:hypothetical protein